MTQESTVDQLALSALVARCAEETDNFFQRRRHDTTHCFEIFRRAIVDRSELAWEAVYRQYNALVLGWIRRHPQFPLCNEEAPYFVNRAYEKMWKALNEEKFGRFATLGPLLRYLQMCANSAIVDYTRRSEREQLELAEGLASGVTVEGEVLLEIEQGAFWELIRSRLNDEKEYRVVYASFVLGLKPRQILVEYDSLFRDVREIYRIKESVMARFRRDAELHERLAAYD